MNYIFSKRPTIKITLYDDSVEIIAIPQAMTFDEIKDNLDKIYPNGYKSVTLGETIGYFSANLRQRIKPINNQ